MDLQYYIFGGVAGDQLTARLLAAADRGVRVRILVDDMPQEDSDREIATVDRHPRVEVRLFNPWRKRGRARKYPLFAHGMEGMLALSRVNQRMHNKLFVADNRVAVVGGRNVDDNYFGLDPRYNFIDCDLLVVGAAVPELSARFDEYWNSKLAYPGGALVGGIDDEDLAAEREDFEERLAAGGLASRVRRRRPRGPRGETASRRGTRALR